MTLQIGILLAFLCAVFSNLGFFFKHRGACACAKVDIRHPLRTAKALWTSKWFAIGMVVGGGGWALHVAAISLAPLSVVQVVLSGGVVLIAVMADRMFGFSVGRRQWWGLALTAIGLILLGITMPNPDGAHATFSSPAMIAFEAALFGMGGLLILGPRAGAPAEHHGVMLAAAAGIMFGVCNVAVKALSGMVGDTGLVGLASPALVVAACASAAAFYASARSLQDGEAVEVIAITGTAANIAGIAGGIIVFGDPMPGTALGIAVQGIAFVLVVVASALTPAPVRSAERAAAPADTLQDLAKRHLWLHFSRMGAYAEADIPIIVKGDGCYVWDEHGNKYLDGLSALFCVNIGHGRVEVAQAGADQAKELGFFTTWSYAHPRAIELAAKLAELAPGDLNRVFFTSGGSESVETALKLARQYHKLTGKPNKHKVIAREVAYHGTTMGALSATGVTALRAPFEPFTPGGCHVPNTNLYRLPPGYGAENLAEAVAHRIEFEGPETVAAVIMEPVQNAGGCFVPPAGYFQRVREICDA